jgi:hypothetical protein
MSEIPGGAPITISMKTLKLNPAEFRRIRQEGSSP